MCGKWGISMFHGENRNDCKRLRCPTPVGRGFMFHGDLFNGVGGLALPHHSGAEVGQACALGPARVSSAHDCRR